MAINLVREQRLVFGAPAPPAHVGAVTGDEESEPVVERSPKRAAAIRVRFAGCVAPGRVIAHERNERCGGERPQRLQFHAGLFLEKIAVQRLEKGREDERLGPVLVHDGVPTHQHRLRLARPFIGRLYPRNEGLKGLGRERQMIGLHCG